MMSVYIVVCACLCICRVWCQGKKWDGAGNRKLCKTMMSLPVVFTAVHTQTGLVGEGIVVEVTRKIAPVTQTLWRRRTGKQGCAAAGQRNVCRTIRMGRLPSDVSTTKPTTYTMDREKGHIREESEEKKQANKQQATEVDGLGRGCGLFCGFSGLWFFWFVVF